jgi:hypothetical protein
MKSVKLLISGLILVFVLSMFVLAAQALVQCPRCHGTGKISSQICQSCLGSGVIKPSVTRTKLLAGGSNTQSNVSGVFHNSESVEVYGVATATLNIQTKTLTGDSGRILLPPNSDTMITVSFDNVPFQNFYASMITLTPEDISCPVCSGTGAAGGLATCPDCSGTGYITESAIGGINFSSLGVPIVGVAAVAFGTAAAVVVVKKKKVTEGKIRGLTSFDYNNWVLGRLSGHGASILDARKGIDGLTSDGVPIVIKQSDNVGKMHIDNFLNAVMQIKAKRGIIVAFGFDKEAYAAVSRAKVNYRIEIKALTVKELIEHKETVLL